MGVLLSVDTPIVVLDIQGLSMLSSCHESSTELPNAFRRGHGISNRTDCRPGSSQRQPRRNSRRHNPTHCRPGCVQPLVGKAPERNHRGTHHLRLHRQDGFFSGLGRPIPCARGDTTPTRFVTPYFPGFRFPSAPAITSGYKPLFFPSRPGPKRFPTNISDFP